jgi:hypothetical protein
VATGLSEMHELGVVDLLGERTARQTDRALAG